jgi:hypothetical protein
MNDLVQEAERLELERQMIELAKQSFLVHWRRLHSPKTVIQFELWYPRDRSNLSPIMRDAILCGMKLGWHYGAA